MPTPRTWISRSEEILSVLQEMRSELLDRPAIEELFRLQRRAAITLMVQAGAVGDKGLPFLLDRSLLIEWVRSVHAKESHRVERKRHLADDLSQHGGGPSGPGGARLEVAPRDLLPSRLGGIADNLQDAQSGGDG